MTIVCGDSHTSTHGAFGALAFGIGTSEVEHVLATQTLLQYKPKTLELRVDGTLGRGVTAKDLILYLIGQITTDGGTGYCIEYTGEAIRGLTMEKRMTVCNMSIEAGARAGMIAPDETTFDYLRGRPFAPSGAAWDEAVATLAAAADRRRREVRQVARVRRGRHRPASHLGHQPRPGRRRSPRRVPQPGRLRRRDRSEDDRPVARVHGPRRRRSRSPTSSSTASSSAPAPTPASKTCGPRPRWSRATAWPTRVSAMVVPGSGQVKLQAEAEGLDRVFKEAGFDWREAGCSMCLAMNPDKLAPGERCASTSNRNFEGRQGKGGRTHLVSPAMAAAAAVAGHFVDVREWN